MNASHYELMSTLKDQREKLAEFVQAFAPPEYATLRTMAVDFLEAVHEAIQLRIETRWLCTAETLDAMRQMVDGTTRAIEIFNAALVAMPQAAYEAVDGGLSEVRK